MLNLEPQYQRKYIWKKDKACRLIESVMGNLFVPAVVLHTSPTDVSHGPPVINWCQNVLRPANFAVQQPLPPAGPLPSRAPPAGRHCCPAD